MDDITVTGTINELKARIRFMEQIDDTKYVMTIKKYREKRSLNANAYLWELVGKIAEKVNEGKDTVYKAMLEDYGQGEVIEVRADVDVSRYFKYIKHIGDISYGEQGFSQYMVYRGSSEYNTKEMSRLIDGVINEANNLGIPTITDEQLERLKGNWKI